MYERHESKTTTHADGREEIHIIREKSGSGVGEFLFAIAAITVCVAGITILCNTLHPQQTIIIQQRKPSN